MKKKILGCAAASIALVLGSGGAAMAGEVNGNGEAIGAPGNAASECVYSGLDTLDSIENPVDSPFYNDAFNDDAIAERGSQKNGYHGVQNYGMFKKVGWDIDLTPGTACRGNGG